MSSYYRVEVRRANPLTAEQESEMFAAYRKRRTAKRREEIVRQYLYWAAELACRYCGPRMPREDAISAANLGLMQAIEDFDPEHGQRFVTHSYFAIRRSVLTALRGTYVVNPSPGMNVARHQFNLSEKNDAAKAEFRAAKREVFDRTGTVVDIAYLEAPHAPAHLSDGFHTIAPDNSPEERDSVEDFSMLRVLREKIATMQNPEKKILTLRYLSKDTPLFKEIGERMNMTEDQVRYVHNRTMQKLRESLTKEV